MAFTMTVPVATPSTLSSGDSVRFSFMATSLDGGGTLHVQYSSTSVLLDGQSSVTKDHHIGSADTPVADTFVVTGSPGQRRVTIATDDGDMQRENNVLLNIQS
jgi:hypothetical protein